jgi:hypothetical protein
VGGVGGGQLSGKGGGQGIKYGGQCWIRRTHVITLGCGMLVRAMLLCRSSCGLDSDIGDRLELFGYQPAAAPGVGGGGGLSAFGGGGQFLMGG